MLYEILSFLIEIGVTLVGGACLLRLAMRWRRMGFAHPVGQLVQAFSDWLVLPLQRLLPATGALDTASLLAVWLLKLVQYALLMALLNLTHWSVLPVLALLGVARLAISVATAVIIIAAVLSWTQSRGSPIAAVLDRLADPLLAPLRRLLPRVGGLDLSPLVALVALQVLGIVLGSLQAGLLGDPMALAAG